jgi:Toprim domain
MRVFVMTIVAKTASHILEERQITLKSPAPGRHYTTCPRCSRSRDKAHRQSACLGVTIDGTGVGWKCFHCGWKGGTFYDSRNTLSRPFGHPYASLAASPAVSNHRTSKDGAQRIFRAQHIFTHASDLRDSPAWKYLGSRGINRDALPPQIHEALRWHPDCPWGENGTRGGCLVALWTDAITGDPRAIHRRLITNAGQKASQWKALGPTKGCVIRLWSDEMVTTGLVIGEGVETTLAAATRVRQRGTLLMPAWAAGDAGHIEEFPLLAGIGALTVLVDHDVNGRAQRATAECVRRWAAAGREVTQLIPRIPGEDFADLVGEYL